MNKHQERIFFYAYNVLSYSEVLEEIYVELTRDKIPFVECNFHKGKARIAFPLGLIRAEAEVVCFLLLHEVGHFLELKRDWNAFCRMQDEDPDELERQADAYATEHLPKVLGRIKRSLLKPV